MYNLGDYLKIDINKAKANEKSVIKGDKFRFTVLTERLIRIEYNDRGILIYEGEYLNEKKNGESKEYDGYNGKLIFEGLYNLGI